MRVLLGQFLAPGSGMTEALDGERRLMKALHGTIEGGARQARNTGDQSDASSPQLFRIDGSDQVLLMLIQMREQHVVFLLKFFNGTHTDSIPRRLSSVTIIYLRTLTDGSATSRAPLTRGAAMPSLRPLLVAAALVLTGLAAGCDRKPPRMQNMTLETGRPLDTRPIPINPRNTSKFMQPKPLGPKPPPRTTP